jgi:diguanylate cyclase (GGDEF)-like protein/PAS domain S-box-containing protein
MTSPPSNDPTTRPDGSTTPSDPQLVDDQVEVRRALAESERRYRIVVDHMTDLIGIMDFERRVQWIAPTITALLGWKPEELVGTIFTDLVHPDDLAMVTEREAALFAAFLEGGPDMTEDLVLRLRRADGSYIWLSGRVRVMAGDDGQPTGLLGVMRDVDELVRTREEARRDRARLQATLDTLIDPHVILGPVRDDTDTIVDFTFLDVNDAACSYNGVTRADLIGARLLDVLPGHVDNGLLSRYASLIETGIPLVLDDLPYATELLSEGEHRFDVRAVRVDGCISCTWREVTDRHRHQQELTDLATHDPLTGLANRTALLEELQRALSAGRRSGRAVAVLMIDLDHFKDVNDTLGHAIGDDVLRAVAHRISLAVRAGDLVARLGGDEFVIVMRDLDDTEEAVRVGRRLVEELRHPLTVAGNELTTTASLGVAIATAASEVFDLMREADTALYRAKDEGRDRYSLYNEDLRREVTERLALEEQLRPALERGELTLWYQPEIDLATGTITAVEALLRWHHPSGEVYAADRFIEVAEDTGLILDIGDWVLREAADQAAAWARLDPDHPLVVRVNLSALQLGEVGLVAAIDEALTASGVDASLLCVETTETALLRGGSTVNANLQAIRHRALRLAVDDFGTGYASLAYLPDRPVDVIKIDRSLMSTITSVERTRQLVAGVIAFAGQLGITVTAEGVEQWDQAALLHEIGCTAVQGFLYSAAVPPDVIPELRERVFPRP